MAGQNASEISEQLFQAIDAIVTERLRILSYDKTVIARIIDNTNAIYGKYKVTTDDNITFYAYSEDTTYTASERVYVRIPGNDYTKQKIITGRYIVEASDGQNNVVATSMAQRLKNVEVAISNLKKLLEKD